VATKFYYASFEGNDTRNGKIKIDKLAVNGGNIIDSTLGMSSSSIYKLSDDLLKKILSVNRAEAYIESFRNSVFTSRLKFLLKSQVIIKYESCHDSDALTSVSSLSNFQFGPPSDDLNVISPNIETFEINIDNIQFTFERKSDYNKLISQCIYNKTTDVTTCVSSEIKKSDMTRSIELLNKVCILLSFSNGNWITPIFTDYSKNGRVIQTVFYKNKTYGFNNSRYLIDPRTSPYVSIVDFLTKSYMKYDISKKL
jgi:hypothetical protein